jgi:hypothetical protein
MSRRRKYSTKRTNKACWKSKLPWWKVKWKNITSKRANKIICPFFILSSGNKKVQPCKSIHK